MPNTLRCHGVLSFPVNSKALVIDLCPLYYYNLSNPLNVGLILTVLLLNGPVVNTYQHKIDLTKDNVSIFASSKVL